MNILQRLVVFTVLFTLIFLVLKTSGLIETSALLTDLGGIPWLYSTIGLIFGVVSAFTHVFASVGRKNIAYAGNVR